MKSLFHSFYLLCIISFSNAQSDSIMGNPFKLNKFKIGVEVGSSPRDQFGYNQGQIYNPKRPFFKGCIGYNLMLKNNWYFSSALGIAYEEFYIQANSSRFTDFSYIDTIGGNTVIYHGSKLLTNINSYSEKRYSATLDLDFQKVYSPFKNEKFKLTHVTGITIKPRIWKNTVSTYSYYRDSSNITNTYVLDEGNFSSEQTSKIKLQNPTDLQFNLNIGLIHDGFILQQQIGFKFQVQWTTFYGYAGAFMRLYYSINF